MNTSKEAILTHIHEANRNAERAYWWIKNIDPEAARRLGIQAMLQQVLDLLQKVDHLTTDIQLSLNLSPL